MNAASTPPHAGGAGSSASRSGSTRHADRPAAGTRQARDFDRLIQDKQRREGEGENPGDAAAAPLPGLTGPQPLRWPVSTAATAEAAAEAVGASGAAARLCESTAQAPSALAAPPELSASAQAMQRLLQGVGAAGEAATLQGSAALQALLGPNEARQFAVSIEMPLGVQLQLQATQAMQGAMVGPAAAGAQAAQRQGAPWVLSIGGSRADQVALARHLPKLEERLRARGVQAEPLHWEAGQDDEEAGA